tara:strand:+ start:387 stop:563 length:177 start_codon:yes stop_codon:yes gene_type:complete
MTEQQHYEYAGYEPTIELAQSLGWEEEPEGATGNEAFELPEFPAPVFRQLLIEGESGI